jgi:two-component system, OmpR family, alkaline phosphatase synthesis response regulator PhoP
MEEPKRRILCAEDDEDTCELLTLVLGRSGYEVVSAYTFADALSKALTGSFDIFLLDNKLPDGTGVDLCRQIREVDTSTPIIFYSADAFEREIEGAYNAGANAYLVKPVDPQELDRTITGLLK